MKPCIYHQPLYNWKGVLSKQYCYLFCMAKDKNKEIDDLKEQLKDAGYTNDYWIEEDKAIRLFIPVESITEDNDKTYWVIQKYLEKGWKGYEYPNTQEYVKVEPPEGFDSFGDKI